MLPLVTGALVAVLLTGCAGSSMVGYASAHRVACIRWTLQLWATIEPLPCVEELRPRGECP
jgi:hypothetical protein